MGKQIWRAVIGTTEQFEGIPKDDRIMAIKDARVYWIDHNNTIMVVASQEWRDYLTGRRESPFVEEEEVK